MINDNAKKWIAALRSGDFKQGRAALNSNSRLCCMGVACELAVADGSVRVSKTLRPASHNVAVPKWAYNGNGGSAPFEVRQWLGLLPFSQSTLINMNDDQNKSFAEIADELEKNSGAYFAQY